MSDNDDTVFIPMSDLLTGFLFVLIIMILTFLPMINQEPVLVLSPPDVGDEQAVATPASTITLDLGQHGLPDKSGSNTIFQTPDTNTTVLKGLGGDPEPEGAKDGLLARKKTGKNQERLVEILEGMSVTLDSLGLSVVLDTDNGIVRLPAAMLFNKAKYTITHEGRAALDVIGNILDDVLKCNTANNSDCVDPLLGKIEAVLVEGHTDNDPIDDGHKIRDNWDLSVFRATTTYRELLSKSRSLSCYKNSYGLPVMGVSGYGESRPVPGNANLNEEEKTLNRRIDLRFIMETESDEPVNENVRWPWNC